MANRIGVVNHLLALIIIINEGVWLMSCVGTRNKSLAVNPIVFSRNHFILMSMQSINRSKQMAKYHKHTHTHAKHYLLIKIHRKINIPYRIKCTFCQHRKNAH